MDHAPAVQPIEIRPARDAMLDAWLREQLQRAHPVAADNPLPDGLLRLLAGADRGREPRRAGSE